MTVEKPTAQSTVDILDGVDSSAKLGVARPVIATGVCSLHGMAPGDLTLADALVGEALFFFNDYEKSERGELTLEEVDKRIDMLGVAIQGLDVARSNPDSWPEYLPAQTSSYDHLWPAEQVMLFLLANYAALHAWIRRDLPLLLISLQSIAREVLLLKWIPHEATNEELLESFLSHPASQAPRSE